MQRCTGTCPFGMFCGASCRLPIRSGQRFSERQGAIDQREGRGVPESRVLGRHSFNGGAKGSGVQAAYFLAA